MFSSLFKKLFFSSKEEQTPPIPITPKIEKPVEPEIDYYANAWTNNEIPLIDQEVAVGIYRHGLNELLLGELFGKDVAMDFEGTGKPEKGELNFPGPFYTGETDTCGTGIINAPHNVVFDDCCQEYMMIQPRTKLELEQLCMAGAVEVFGGYFCDGNELWTVQKVRDWWKNREDFIVQLSSASFEEMNCGQNKRYIAYLNGEAEMDLRRYCYFLEHGVYPEASNLELPLL